MNIFISKIQYTLCCVLLFNRADLLGVEKIGFDSPELNGVLVSNPIVNMTIDMKDDSKFPLSSVSYLLKFYKNMEVMSKGEGADNTLTFTENEKFTVGVYYARSIDSKYLIAIQYFNAKPKKLVSKIIILANYSNPPEPIWRYINKEGIELEDRLEFSGGYFVQIKPGIKFISDRYNNWKFSFLLEPTAIPN